MVFNDNIKKFKEKLKPIYSDRELNQVSRWVFEDLMNAEYHNLWTQNPKISDDIRDKSNLIADRLLNGEPLQYILNKAWFLELELFVNPHTLIPRPETEELAQWIIKSSIKLEGDVNILDIGTGSGCIALALKKHIPEARICASDISAEALKIAKKNAKRLNLSLDFQQLDILNTSQWKQLGSFNIIVSNPPYVLESDKVFLEKNVVDHEPGLALFVTDRDPLVFYHSIAEFCQRHLNPGGCLYFEIHEKMGTELVKLLRSKGFNDIELKMDLSGKNRMIRAVLE